MQVRSLLAAVGVVLQASAAAADSFSPCKEPIAYDSAINVYALADTPEEASELDALTAATGERLALLVKLDTLFNDSFGSLGVHFVHQRGAEPPCTLDEVVDRIEDVLPESGAAVLTTHHLFTEEERILLQTYLRFLQKMARTPLQLELQNGTFTFKGDLPARAVAFTPHLVSRADLEAIAGLFEAASRIYAAPDIASPSNELPLAPTEAVPIWVVGMHADGWLEVRSNTGLNGWLRANPAASRRLRALLPELELLEAIVGYLSLDADGNWNVLPATVIAPRVIQRLEAFLAKAEERAPQALAAALLADVTLFRRFPVTATPERVLEELVAAVIKRPEDAELRNLLGLARWLNAARSRRPPTLKPASPASPKSVLRGRISRRRSSWLQVLSTFSITSTSCWRFTRRKERISRACSESC